MSVTMRRFSVAVIVLAVVGAFLTALGSPDVGGQQSAARSKTVKPDKRQFVERRRERIRFALAGRVGESAAAIDKATMTAAKTTVTVVAEKAPARAQKETALTAGEAQRAPAPGAQAVSPQPQPQPQAQSVSQSQPSPQAITGGGRQVNSAPQTEANTAQTSGVEYLPPSMRAKADASGTNDGTAAKSKPKAKTQQAGARVIYRTHQTSGYDRGYYQRGGYGRGNYQPWGW